MRTPKNLTRSLRRLPLRSPLIPKVTLIFHPFAVSFLMNFCFLELQRLLIARREELKAQPTRPYNFEPDLHNDYVYSSESELTFLGYHEDQKAWKVFKIIKGKSQIVPFGLETQVISFAFRLFLVCFGLSIEIVF